MDDFYFISASLITAFVVTAVPVRYYLQVTRSLSKEKRLYKFRDKLRRMPVLAVAGAIFFCIFLSQNNDTAAYISFLVTAISFSISVISVLATLTTPQCRIEGRNTPETKLFRLLVNAIWIVIKVIIGLQSGASSRTEKNSFSSPSFEGYESYQKTFDKDFSLGRIDSYGRFKD